ncbi:cyclophilin-like fold protein [Thermodesulfobacterium hveragerdense]|uniref:cyclophilin-like fold protein n=1 Tax=Thermodesulfobacterium hveragerdense TaxID=53424 RepID=UPI0003FD4337|nr:cyclophilin-like fold protein [Thermodesulfobacterium hveragerdense]
MKVKLIFDGKEEVLAELFDTPCGQEVYKILPIESYLNTWGDEFYFSIPLDHPLDETATLKVKSGDIGYWPPGKALAIFFGPTPISVDDEPIPASEVILVGRLLEDPKKLKELKNSKKITIIPVE